MISLHTTGRNEILKASYLYSGRRDLSTLCLDNVTCHPVPELQNCRHQTASELLESYLGVLTYLPKNVTFLNSCASLMWCTITLCFTELIILETKLAFVPSMNKSKRFTLIMVLGCHLEVPAGVTWYHVNCSSLSCPLKKFFNFLFQFFFLFAVETEMINYRLSAAVLDFRCPSAGYSSGRSVTLPDIAIKHEFLTKFLILACRNLGFLHYRHSKHNFSGFEDKISWRK